MKINHTLNYNHLEHPGEINTDPSLTIPGESYTIPELLDKFAHGIMPPVGRRVQYDEDPDIDNVDPTRDPAFDLSDLTRLKEESEATLSALEAETAERDKKASKAEAIKEAKKLLELESEAKEQEPAKIPLEPTE